MGIIFGVAQLMAMCLVMSFYYRVTISKISRLPRNNTAALRISIYVICLWSSAILLTGEFTSIIIAAIIKITTVLLVHNCCRVRFNLTRAGNT
jgi:hypothetical protein